MGEGVHAVDGLQRLVLVQGQLVEHLVAEAADVLLQLVYVCCEKTMGLCGGCVVVVWR